MTVDTVVAAERVDVLCRADQPAHFLWRGRLYAVRSVRAHWFEGADQDRPTPGGLDRELWRVDAAPGRTAPVGVYDLCLTRPAGDWALTPAAGADR